MPAKLDNPEGFWEHIHLVYINDRLLDIADGAWDAPPESDDDFWANGNQLIRLRKRAGEIIDQLREKKSVGIKDPRFCLTLPFWLKLSPAAKVVICLRDPIEVAQSLKSRNGMSQLLALKLWRRYYAKIVETTQPEKRLVTNYTAFFDAPEQEIRRINDWLGLTPSNKVVEEACATIKKEMCHHRLDELKTNEQLETNRYAPIKKLYFRLLEEAQPHGLINE